MMEDMDIKERRQSDANNNENKHMLDVAKGSLATTMEITQHFQSQF